MAQLLAHWREQAWPVVHVQHSSLEPNSTYRPGQSGFEFKPEVAPQPNEKIVTKHTNSAFIATELDAWLRARQIGTLVICGVIRSRPLRRCSLHR